MLQLVVSVDRAGDSQVCGWWLSQLRLKEHYDGSSRIRMYLGRSWARNTVNSSNASAQRH